MNFNKILTQLNHIQLQNQLIDHKFMTTHTYNTKYHHLNHINQNIHSPNHQQNHQHNHNHKHQHNHFRLSHQSHQPPPSKHRYFEDIQSDEIQDASIFGYSTFDYFTFFKTHSNQPSKHSKPIRMSQPHPKHPKNNHSFYQPPSQITSFTRPKTAIVSRGTPTKRRVHHKLSLNHTQQTSKPQPIPTTSKQQYFTQQIFDFNPHQINTHPTMKNIRCGSKKLTFQFKATPKDKKSPYYFDKQNAKHKKSPILQPTITNFHPIQNKEKKLNKKAMKNNLNHDQKSKPGKRISQKIDHIIKKQTGNKQTQNGMGNINDLQSAAYNRQANNRKVNEEVAYYTQSIKQKTLDSRYASPNHSNVFVINPKNDRTFNDTLNQQNSPQKTLSLTKNTIHQPNSPESQFLKQLKISTSLTIYHSINPFLFQRGELTDLNFKYDNHCTPLNHTEFDKNLIQTINRHCTEVSEFKSKSLQHFNPRSFSKLPKHHFKTYTITMIECVTLDWIKLQNVELKDDKFDHKGNFLNLLLIAEKMMKTSLPTHFVHMIITRTSEDTADTNSNSQVLVYETFIHNSDIKYFEGREVQIQYFKYFLKRFMTFDPNVHKKEQIHSNVSLVFQTEVKTPVQFQDFCKEMKIKDNMNILALRNLESRQKEVTFRSVEISLSKLLIDASETVMLVKKQLIQGYDWRGVSLAKGYKQYRGYHLEHFYI